MNLNFHLSNYNGGINDGADTPELTPNIEGSGSTGERSKGTEDISRLSSIQKNPTFKMWFSKNARRPDVMKAGANETKLQELYLKDVGDVTGTPLQNQLTFSNEIDAYGNVDRRERPIDLSSKLIGGMRYGGTPRKTMKYGGHTKGNAITPNEFREFLKRRNG